jgi:hypothetical protein
MEPVKTDHVIHSEKAKDLIVIKGFKFRFQRVFAEDMARWCCTNKKCKCCIKCNEIREIFGSIVRQNHDKDCEATLNRQIFNNSVTRKATEDLCERARKLIHKELGYSHLSRRTEHSSCALLLPPLPTKIEETHEALG